MNDQKRFLKIEFMKNRHWIKSTFEDKSTAVKSKVQDFLHFEFDHLRKYLKMRAMVC